MLVWSLMSGLKAGSRHFQISTRKVLYILIIAIAEANLAYKSIHKCRPYSKVLDWARDNYVHSRNVSDLERAPGALERDTRPWEVHAEYFRINRWSKNINMRRRATCLQTFDIKQASAMGQRHQCIPTYKVLDISAYLGCGFLLALYQYIRL